MQKKRSLVIFSLFLVISLLLLLSGCAGKGADSAKQAPENNDKAVMDSFNELLQNKEAPMPDIVAFIDKNYAVVSTQNATAMIIGLEQVQKERLVQYQNLFNQEQMQKIVGEGYQGGLTDDFINGVVDQSIKKTLLEIKNSGFKVETAEGMFYPVIDYSFYKKYRHALMQDIAGYLDIMSVESDKPPVKDAALRISWPELLSRALEQERFIKNYGDSAKVNDVKQVLNSYMLAALYGMNNTPLFSYETQEMVPDAKTAYLQTSFDANNGVFSKMMSEYLAVLKQSNYKLTSEVQQYRNQASEQIC